MGRDPCVAQLAQLVEEPEGVDPLGAGDRAGGETRSDSVAMPIGPAPTVRPRVPAPWAWARAQPPAFARSVPP